MSAFLRPDSDATVGSWTDTPLWEKINETTPNDSPVIESDAEPTNSMCEVGLSNPASTSESTHTIRLRHRKLQSGGGSHSDISLTIALVQGTTVIRSEVYNIAGNDETWYDRTFELTAGEITDITDYNDLRFRFTANQTAGARTGWAVVSWAEMEIDTGPQDIFGDIDVESTSTSSIDGGLEVGSSVDLASTSSVSIDGDSFALAGIDLQSVSSVSIDSTLTAVGSVDVVSTSSVQLAIPLPVPDDPHTVYANHVLHDNPIAYWRLGERDVEDPAADLAGHTVTVVTDEFDEDEEEFVEYEEIQYSDGTYHPDSVLGVPGAIAGDPDTAVGPVTMDADDPVLGVTGAPYTYEAWIRRSDPSYTPNNTYMFSTRVNDSFDATIRFTGDTSLGVWHRDADGNIHTIGVTTNIDQWNHVVLVWDGAEARLYNNGEFVSAREVDTAHATGKTFQYVRASNGLQAHFGFDVVAHPFEIDEPAIYDRVLSPEQIKRHYEIGSSGRYYIETADDDLLTIQDGVFDTIQHDWAKYGDSGDNL